MNTNIDQGTLDQFDDGKYLYKFDNESSKYDIDKFNRNFDQYKDKRKEEMIEKINQKLSELNKPPEITPPYSLSIGQIFINIKDTLFNIIDDLLNFKLSFNSLLKENGLFYLGLFFLIIAGILYFYSLFLDVTPNIHQSNSTVTHIHEIKIT